MSETKMACQFNAHTGMRPSPCKYRARFRVMVDTGYSQLACGTHARSWPSREPLVQLLDVDRLWRAIRGVGVLESGAGVSFQREDAETIATLYAAEPAAGRCTFKSDDGICGLGPGADVHVEDGERRRPWMHVWRDEKKARK